MDKTIKNVIYYWYDHLLIRQLPDIEKAIDSCIKNHEYDVFKQWQFLLNYRDKINDCEFLIYLPDSVFVEYEDGDYDTLPMTEELFNKISYNEYECG